MAAMTGQNVGCGGGHMLACCHGLGYVCVWPVLLGEKEEKAPTSRINSLVLCVAGMVEGKGKKSTNES